MAVALSLGPFVRVFCHWECAQWPLEFARMRPQQAKIESPALVQDGMALVSGLHFLPDEKRTWLSDTRNLNLIIQLHFKCLYVEKACVLVTVVVRPLLCTDWGWP